VGAVQQAPVSAHPRGGSYGSSLILRRRQRIRPSYVPFTSRSKRGLPRRGAKLGSILSQPDDR
jgi:hypothetical protein